MKLLFAHIDITVWVKSLHYNFGGQNSPNLWYANEILHDGKLQNSLNLFDRNFLFLRIKCGCHGKSILGHDKLQTRTCFYDILWVETANNIQVLANRNLRQSRNLCKWQILFLTDSDWWKDIIWESVLWIVLSISFASRTWFTEWNWTSPDYNRLKNNRL